MKEHHIPLPERDALGLGHGVDLRAVEGRARGDGVLLKVSGHIEEHAPGHHGWQGVGAELREALGRDEGFRRGVVVVHVLAAHVAEAIDLAADAHPGSEQIVVPRGFVRAHGGARAVPRLKNGNVEGARGVGRGAAPGDAAEGVGFPRGTELGGLEHLFRAQAIEGSQRIVRSPG